MDVWTTSSLASVFRALLGNAALTSRMCSAAVSLHASNMSREQTSTSLWNGFDFQVENHPWWMSSGYHPEPKQEFWALGGASGQEYNQENGCALWIHLPQSDCQCRVLLSFSKNSVEATSSVRHTATSSQRKTLFNYQLTAFSQSLVLLKVNSTHLFGFLARWHLCTRTVLLYPFIS